VQLNISVRHGHISEATQEQVRDKLEKLARFYGRLGKIDATLDMEHREVPVVDLKVSVKKHEFVALGQGTNLLAALDVAVERMEQQLRKHKEKVRDRHRSGGRQ